MKSKSTTARRAPTPSEVLSALRTKPATPVWRISSHTDRVGFVGHGSEAHAQAFANRLNQHRATNRYSAARLETTERTADSIDLAAVETGFNR